MLHFHSTQAICGLAGALAGMLLVPLCRFIPHRVLQAARAPLEEWQGPGGGLGQPLPPARRIWVPVFNAGLWVYASSNPGGAAFPASLPGCMLASTLLLLALIDWDTTLLPDWIVVPFGAAGLAASYAGLLPQSLVASISAAGVVLGLLGGLAWGYRRFRGERGIGGGDLKLLAALAAWFGLAGVLNVMFLAGVVTVVWYLVWRRFRGLSPEAEWPFGPAIAVAALIWSLHAA
jgi:leader peptidase (prepilin peptidase)/N-methyltransferase